MTSFGRRAEPGRAVGAGAGGGVLVSVERNVRTAVDTECAEVPNGGIRRIRPAGNGEMGEAMRGLVVAVAIVLTGAVPGGAIEYKTSGIDGTLTVAPDFTTCGSLRFPGSTAFAGELAAVGHLQGPGTKAGTVRGATPFVAVGSWSGCIDGSYEGATVGDGKFTLTAHSSEGDFVKALQCVVANGAIRCV